MSILPIMEVDLNVLEEKKKVKLILYVLRHVINFSPPMLNNLSVTVAIRWTCPDQGG